MNTQAPIAIIGAGITGLAAAHALARKNIPVHLYEASPRAGGSIQTLDIDGWLIETGPNALLAKTDTLPRLLEQLRLAPQHPEPDARNRYLVRNQKLHPLPLNPFAALTTPLFSTKLKLRILREALFARPKNRPADIPLAQLAREHFGDEFIDYALNPMIAGIYAGDPEQLSAQHALPQIWQAEQTHGSIIRGQLAQARQRKQNGGPEKLRLLSFPRGLQTLIDALRDKLPPGTLRLNTPIAKIISRPPADEKQLPATRYSLLTTAGVQTSAYSRIILALPAHALARLAIDDKLPLASLVQIPYPPVTTLYLGYQRDQIRHPLDGFGALAPEIEKLPFLGVLFSSSLFSGRPPTPGHAALTVMIGGTRQPELTQLPPAELLQKIHPPLARLFGITGNPVFTHHQTHPAAIPQYNVNHQRHLDLMDAVEKQHAGLHILGHARHGISVPACIESGLCQADQIP